MIPIEKKYEVMKFWKLKKENLSLEEIAQKFKISVSSANKIVSNFLNDTTIAMQDKKMTNDEKQLQKGIISEAELLAVPEEKGKTIFQIINMR